MEENRIKIIVPFYNASEFLERCINSVMTQKYENFKVVFIDDASTDNSWDLLPHDNPKAICIKNEINVTALPNLHNAIMNHCSPDEIVVIVDGDDYLPNKNVLSYVNKLYCENDCWITYGQASWTDGRRGFASKYSTEEFDHVRKSPFRVSHLRTFRAGLYQKIKDQDSEFTRLKDEKGNFYKWSYDTAMMFCLMELAGYEKTLFNDTILYIYNRENPLSEDKINQQAQWDVHKEVSKKIPLKKIDSYE